MQKTDFRLELAGLAGINQVIITICMIYLKIKTYEMIRWALIWAMKIIKYTERFQLGIFSPHY
jgi:hypothetical protein